jgi:protein-disulfide isomerase
VIEGDEERLEGARHDDATPGGQGEEAGASQPGAGGEDDEIQEQQPSEAAEERRVGETRRYLLTAAVSAGVLLFALAFFMAGFAARALLDEGDDSTSPGSTDGLVLSNAADDDPSWGPEAASVVIEEFGDFQCPFCGSFARETLPRIRETYGDKVRYIYRDFPISNIHPNAQKAAEAAQCAQEQGRFWEYHDLLFANQEALAISDLKRYAREAEMDTDRFDGCLDSGKNAREVLLDLQDGQGSGVTGTPAFLINGLLVTGAQPFEVFQEAIDQALVE